jgi:NAD(P)-dependent dehydrogenase (short-subunit alcohol dehydrogenase family)
MHITGNTIWLTGATSGLGRELALQLAAAGNHVIASGRNETALQRLVEDSGGVITRLALDLTDRASMARAVERLHIVTNKLDMVIVNAGTCEYLDPRHFDSALVRRVMEVNFSGAVDTIAAALPLLQRASKPRIVVISSLDAVLGLARTEAYGASKAALESFARSLAVDLANTEIGVTIVRPGFAVAPRHSEDKAPFQLSASQTAERIIHGLAKRRTLVEFPRRLSWPLHLLAYMPETMRRGVAVRLSQ